MTLTGTLWTVERVTGSLLVGSLVIGLVALTVMIASGVTSGSSAMIRGDLASAAPHAATLRVLNLLFAIAWIVQLCGLALLARHLARSGQQQFALVALTLVLIATLLAVLDTTFRASVELWAAQEAERTGSVPELFGPLQAWTHEFFRIGYLAHLLAGIGFGWGIICAGLLAPWVGWTAVGWSALWLAAGVLGIGAPAIPLLMPALIGVALLMR